MTKMLLAATLAAVAIPTMPAPVAAQPYGWHDNDRHRDNWRHRDTYRERRLSRGDHVWRGRDGRYYCRRSDGSTGLIVGMAFGGLLGNALSDGHDRTFGTLMGMAGGGLLGRSIDRGEVRCR